MTTPAATSVNAMTSVFRLQCPDEGTMGTAFLHKSGNLITAAHVVEKCQHPTLVLHDNRTLAVSVLASDKRTDLALVKPSAPVTGTALAIRIGPDLAVGAPVALWGFPAGYYGNPPMFSAGYIAGTDALQVAPKDFVRQLVVNAAFNGGNSGGPLVLVETGEVIGVVSSKVTGLTPSTAAALGALHGAQSGLDYTATRPDGSVVNLVEGQVIAMVLEDLRNQVQLVIGRAVITGDIIDFLKANKIDP